MSDPAELPPVPAPSPSPPAPPDATGLYGLAGLAICMLAVTAVIYLFCTSANPFIQGTFLPHFFRFGFYGEWLLAGIALYVGYRHVARLTLRHRILRALWIGLLIGALVSQYQLHVVWLQQPHF